MGYIELRSGCYFDPIELKLLDCNKPVTVEDIAWALIRENRFNGQTKRSINVLSHSINLYNYIKSLRGNANNPWPDIRQNEIEFFALIHEWPEAFLKDIPSPIKHSDSFVTYRQLEAKLEEYLFDKVIIEVHDLSIVRPFDINGISNNLSTFHTWLKPYDNEIRLFESISDKLGMKPWTQSLTEEELVNTYLDLLSYWGTDKW